MQMLNNYSGMQIVILPFVKEFVQIRCHKKKRINKKWRKCYGVKAIPYEDDTVYIANRTIYCTSKIAELIRNLTI